MKAERKDRIVNISKILVLGGIIIAFVAPVSSIFTDSTPKETETERSS